MPIAPKLIVVIVALIAASSGASFYLGQHLLLADRATLCGTPATEHSNREFFSVPPAPMTGNKRY